MCLADHCLKTWKIYIYLVRCKTKTIWGESRSFIYNLVLSSCQLLCFLGLLARYFASAKHVYNSHLATWIMASQWDQCVTTLTDKHITIVTKNILNGFSVKYIFEFYILCYKLVSWTGYLSAYLKYSSFSLYCGTLNILIREGKMSFWRFEIIFFTNDTRNYKRSHFKVRLVSQVKTCYKKMTTRYSKEFKFPHTDWKVSIRWIWSNLKKITIWGIIYF